MVTSLNDSFNGYKIDGHTIVGVTKVYHWRSDIRMREVTEYTFKLDDGSECKWADYEQSRKPQPPKEAHTNLQLLEDIWDEC